jgi:LmbE family N-acetylglucosaminyl deacetylase
MMSYDKIMIVAHPDDETIFGGAQLIREAGWLVVCVTNGDNKVRRKEFTKVMHRVNAEYEMWTFKDRWKGDFDRSRLKSELIRVLDRRPVRKIVTHSLQGEYGHTQHIAISELLHELVPCNLYVFDRADRKLDEDVLARKRKLLRYYRSQNITKFKKYVRFEGIKQVL